MSTYFNTSHQPFPTHFTLKNQQPLLIREAEKADASEMIKYIHQIAAETDFLSFGEGEFNVTIQEEERIIARHHQAINCLFILAILNGEIVGMLNVKASGKPRMRHIGEFGISVLKNHWGKGIGTALIRSMMDWAKATGVIRKLNLKVQTSNHTAIQLYKKLGFVKEGLIRRDSCIRGVFYDTYAMGMLID